jgi:hypothetical protein
MSRLSLYGRPFTVFNPGDRSHRQHYFNFVKTGTWGRCPVRFVVPEDYGDLVTMIQRSLINYYVEREFVKQSKPKKSIRNIKVPKKQLAMFHVG